MVYDKERCYEKDNLCINFNIIAVKSGFVKGYTLFSGTDPLGHLNRAGGSPYPGGSFFSTG